MFAGKEVKVFLKGKARESYDNLISRNDKEAKSLINSIERTIVILKKNPQYGEPLAKSLIPNEFKVLEIQNLYRVELSNYWRMLYTIEGDKIEILLFILSIANHKEYDKLLGYKS